MVCNANSFVLINVYDVILKIVFKFFFVECRVVSWSGLSAADGVVHQLFGGLLFSVVSPHADYFHYFFFLVYLIYDSVLNVNAP